MAVDYDIWKLARLASALEYHLNPETPSSCTIKKLLCPEISKEQTQDQNCILIFLDRLSLVGLMLGRINMDIASFINQSHQKFLIPISILDFLSRLMELVLLALYPDSIDDLPDYDYDSYLVDPYITKEMKFLTNLTDADIYSLSLVHLYILELFCISCDDLLFMDAFATLLAHYSYCVQTVLPDNPELCQIMSTAEIEEYSKNSLMSIEGKSTEIRLRLALVAQVIHQILVDRLTNSVYNPETCSQSSREIADEIKNRLKDMEFDRYKFVVNVIMGEVRGEGVK
ncbi:Tctex1 domain-containing protein 2 [Terramyces sp. JEL0728]|nr:Tctex1 domain-containing protein 2 [Terramyces sp. JEL0728]